jgi:hypothetical protein
MPQVVKPWQRRGDFCEPTRRAKIVERGAMMQPPSPTRDKHRHRTFGCHPTSGVRDVALQRVNGRFANRQGARLAKLSPANGQESGVDIEIADVESVSLADAKPGRVQESDERCRGGRAQAIDGGETTRCGEYAIELLWRYDPSSPLSQRTRRRWRSRNQLDGCAMSLRVRESGPYYPDSVFSAAREQWSQRLEVLDDDIAA